MQFKLIALLTLAVASVNGAAVFKRFSGTCDCAGTIYSNAAISQAVQQSRGRTFGRRKYPHRFNNRENLSSSVAGCTAGTLEEFPILSGKLFNGSPDYPGPDRVIFSSSAASCGCITHSGASGNGFNLCT
ncbi:ribonuclease T1 [Thelephora terrestris]|uniref:Ribonuclease T1 n=1 Tax=Thelephora terrestris TaxID=56493 RepID=A0A9P6HKQ7_9AGAM|nr:ribonuclease T1 [Thelephora terrestris]